MYPKDGTLDDQLKWCIDQYIDLSYKAVRAKDLDVAQKAIAAVENLTLRLHGETPTPQKKKKSNVIPLTKSQQAEIAKMGSYGKPS